MNSAPRVLVVDDNERNCKLVEAMLEADDFEVTTVHDGATALDLFASEEPHLVLLDIMMPGMNGYEVCEKLRAMPNGDRVGIVFLTALDDVSSYQRAMDAGGNDFLSKPINGDELVMRARSLLWINQLRHELDRGSDLLREQRNSLLVFQRQRDELMSFLIHDLKSMLSSVISNASYVTRQLDDGPAQEAVKDILEVGNSMKKLAENLLQVGQGEEGSLVVHRGTVDLEFALGELCAQYARRLENDENHDDVSVEVDVEAGLRAEIDEDLFFRMVDNLLDNATKYAPDGTTITVKAYGHDGGVRVEVRDQGPGIDVEHREQVFKKYFRVKDGRSGTGVGLAFCRMVAVEHGGAVWIEENDPSGCVVCVQLPG